MQQDGPSTLSRAERPSASGESTLAPSLGGGPVEAMSVRGIGIGLESIASFPEIESYLEHEFYRARFTDAELALCAGLASPRSSLCALAAVKRAVVKSGAVAPPESLAALEIACDETGKPVVPDCLVSLDQSETTAVAVCLWAPVPVVVKPGRPLGSYPPLQRLGIRLLMGLAGLSLLIVFGAGIWFILIQIFE